MNGLEEPKFHPPTYGLKGFLWRAALQTQLLPLHLAVSPLGSCLSQQLW